MLSPADEAVCARDPALPGLAGILAAERLAEELGLTGLRQSYLRYKPGTSAVAGLTAIDGSLRAFAAMTYRPDRYAEVRARPEWRAGSDPVLLLDEACTAIAPASRDRNISAARRICDPERRDSYIARFGLPHATLTLLRYKPGRRLVLRADDAAGPVAVLKSHAEDGFHAAVAGARHATATLGLRLPVIDESRRCIVFPWVGGRTLCPATSGRDAFRATGAELARLHSVSSPRAEARSGWDADEMRVEAEALAILLPGLGRDARRLGAALVGQVVAAPQAAVTIHGDFSADQVVMSGAGPGRRRIETIALAAQAAAASLGTSAPTGIHRDFHPDQVLVDAGGLWLLDLDLYARGDPAIDVANFLAHLAELGLRRNGGPSSLAREAEAFVAGYEGQRGRVDRRRLRALYWISRAPHPDQPFASGPDTHDGGV